MVDVKHSKCIDCNTFKVKLIQLYYDDNYVEYMPIKEEDITLLVCI